VGELIQDLDRGDARGYTSGGRGGAEAEGVARGGTRSEKKQQ